MYQIFQYIGMKFLWERFLHQKDGKLALGISGLAEHILKCNRPKFKCCLFLACFYFFIFLLVLIAYQSSWIIWWQRKTVEILLLEFILFLEEEKKPWVEFKLTTMSSMFATMSQRLSSHFDLIIWCLNNSDRAG